MHPIEDSAIKMINEVGRQDEGTIEVLQLAEEDSDQSVSVQTQLAPPLEEDIRFVDQQHCLPRARDTENVGELRFQFCRIRAQFAGRDLEYQLRSDFVVGE